MREGTYLYGIIEANGPREFGHIGIGNRGDKVYTVLHQDIGAVVSHSPLGAFDALPKEVLVGYLGIHQFVIEQVMKSGAVLPVKFGTVVRHEKEVEEILEAGYRQLKATLKEKHHKIEFEVVAFWSGLDSILQEIGQEEEIQKFKEMAVQQPAHQLRENQITLGKMVNASLARKRASVAAEILEAIKDQAEDLRFHDLMDDAMILNVALLMDQDREQEFDWKIRELNLQYQEQINFRCIGPLPPYSFSTVEVDKLGFTVVDQARRVLELGTEATLSQIKETHRRLTRVYHPDRNGDDPQAAERFKQLSHAYKILTEYCQNQRYSFRREDVKDQIMVQIRQL